jgi:hypothetical protein
LGDDGIDGVWNDSGEPKRGVVLGKSTSRMVRISVADRSKRESEALSSRPWSGILELEDWG